MQIKRILVPTDFSEHSAAALRFATALARDTGAILLIVHVKGPADTFHDTGFAGWRAAEDEAALSARLNKAIPADPDVGHAHHLLEGARAEEIVRFAKEKQADLIVLGTHGRTGLGRLLMGSTAESVVRRAACPVLSIKQPE